MRANSNSTPKSAKVSKSVSLASVIAHTGADPGFLKGGGVQIRSTSKKGGADGGPILGPMLTSLHRGTKGGVRTPWTPPPPLDPLLP